MIFLGAELVVRYTWVLIIFGLFLVLTAVKMAVLKSEGDPAKNPVGPVLVSKALPVVPFMDGLRFFTRCTVAPSDILRNERGRRGCTGPAPTGTLRTGGLFSGGWAATPLFLALVMVEVTDLIFAVDFIPAISLSSRLTCSSSLRATPAILA